MIFSRSDRRRLVRYQVAWPAILSARFIDIGDEMDVRLGTFSATGALIYTSRLDIRGRHLVVARPLPDLTLTVDTPAGDLVVKVEVRWYNWSVATAGFQVGTAFLSPDRAVREQIDRLVRQLRATRTPTV
jgi:hypothetical protein